jgi:glycosidase
MNVIFPGNHDLDRIFTVMGESYGKFRIAQTFIMTTRGIPQLYYGDEILMTGGGPDGLKRKDFPGGWEKDPVSGFTQEGREELSEETGYPVAEAHNFVSTLANWRQENDVIHTGELTHFIPENNVYVYFRHNDNKRVMVVLNGNEGTDVLYLSRFAEMIQGAQSGYDVISGETIELGETLNLDGYETMVIELNGN